MQAARALFRKLGGSKQGRSDREVLAFATAVVRMDGLPGHSAWASVILRPNERSHDPFFEILSLRYEMLKTSLESDANDPPGIRHV